MSTLKTQIAGGTAVAIAIGGVILYKNSRNNVGNQKPVDLKDIKNIVVVGYGPAGVEVVEALAGSGKLPKEYRIVVVEKTGFTFHPIGALRASIKKGLEDTVYHPLPTGHADWLKKPHIILPYTSVLSISPTSVTLSKPHPEFDISEQLNYSHLIVATGSNYVIPNRLPSNVLTPDQARASLQDFQTQVSKATSVLIIGGGTVAIEVAGEFKDAYPSLDVTLVTKDALPMSSHFPTATGFSKALLRDLTALNVKVVTEDKVNTEGLKPGLVEGGEKVFVTEKGKEIKADFIFIASGTHPNAELLKTISSDVVIENEGAKVKGTFQIDAKGFENVFVLGDAAAVKGEWKNAIAITKQAPFVVKNVLAAINGKPLTDNYTSGPKLAFVPIGTKRGSATAFGFTIPTFLVRKIKGENLFVDKFKGHFKPIKQ